MPTISTYRLASVAAVTVLMSYIVVAVSTAQSDPAQIAQRLDLPSIPEANAATVEYFLKVEGIKGESNDDGHEGEIEVISFRWGLSSEVSIGDVGKADFQDLSVAKVQDKSSTKLFLASASAKIIDKITLTGIRTDLGGEHFLKIELRKVIISSFEEAGVDGELPMENITLNYQTIVFEYRPANPDGTLGPTFKDGWDVVDDKEV
ncbi:MAG: type VI secretion system tube protein Hcp [Nitrososphaera sp.]|nr:type VI secretion system tube protein Hcp [Nitrososphaera sp.]